MHVGLVFILCTAQFLSVHHYYSVLPFEPQGRKIWHFWIVLAVKHAWFGSERWKTVGNPVSR